jgi:sugar lactone lactonase YvrE
MRFFAHPSVVKRKRSTTMSTRPLSLLAVSAAMVVLSGSCSSSSSDTPGGAAACGTTPTAFDLSMAGRAEGLVIAPDGTVYMSNFGTNVMRYVPPYDKGIEKTWATVPNSWIFGIMLDPKKKVIYAGARTPKMMTTPPPMVYKIDTTDPTKFSKLADAEGGINGLTMGDDGSVYYADQCCNAGMADPERGHIYRITPEGVKTRVTKTPIDNADGIAFGPDKKLYVIPYLETTCPITRLTLDGTFTETSRDVYVDLTASGGIHGDGIAFDSKNNLYLTAGGLWKVTPDKVVTKLNMQGGANIEFGVGALSCSDIIWATNSNTIAPMHITSDITGLDVYWHRN